MYIHIYIYVYIYIYVHPWNVYNVNIVAEPRFIAKIIQNQSNSMLSVIPGLILSLQPQSEFPGSLLCIRDGAV